MNIEDRLWAVIPVDGDKMKHFLGDIKDAKVLLLSNKAETIDDLYYYGAKENDNNEVLEVLARHVRVRVNDNIDVNPHAVMQELVAILQVFEDKLLKRVTEGR